MKAVSERFISLPAAAKLLLLALAVFISGSLRRLITASVPAASPTASSFLSFGLRVLLLFLPFLLFELLGTGHFTGTLSVGGHSMKRLPLYFAAMQLISVLAGFVVRTVCMLLPNANRILAAAPDYGAYSIPALMVTAIDLCIFTPLLEEYVFRGVIFGVLKTHGTRFAVLASAVIFGIAHGSVDHAAYAFFAGLFMVLLYSYVNDIRVTVVLHALNNALGLLQDAVLPRLLSEDAQLVTSLIYLLVIAVCGTVSLIWLLRRYKAARDGGYHDAR